jgi:hypothetical protein
VALELPPEVQAGLDALEPDLRAAAASIGLAVQAELVTRKPALLRTEGGSGAPRVVLVSLDLERDGDADLVSLAACLAAHGGYVRSRGDAHGVSLGALALSRLLVWSTRAALLGPAPRLVWIGPPARCPELGSGQISLTATAAATVDDVARRAQATGVFSAP